MKGKERKTGVLMHITSLPSEYGIGDLGDAAYRFIDRLSESGIRLWQILPLGPTGFGDSPYSARSAFAGNELLISPRKLFMDGYLELEDIVCKAESSKRVDYSAARSLKTPLLRKAAGNLIASGSAEYSAFLEKEGWWLDDYALFQALCDKYNDSRWASVWPEDVRKRKAKAISKVSEELKDRIEEYKAMQFFFFSQYAELKAYANGKNVEIIGDIPIFVAPDSADAWSNPKLLMMDKECHQEASSGVPPDAFSATGQLWGNPLYRWPEHKKTGYKWWIERIRKTFELCDIVRIDHFRGFEAYWEIPEGEETALNGKWVKGPGQDFFDAVKGAFGEDLPIIAEDLGVITPEVEKLRDDNGLPGMKILQFAFAFEDGEWQVDNAYLPHNAVPLSVAYTGTHDNNTSRGWFNSLDDGTKDYVRRYFECSDDEVVWKMIRALLGCSSMYAIIPMQDILGLGEDARMNVPSTCGSSNWSWKMDEKDIDSPAFESIRYMSHLFGRS